MKKIFYILVGMFIMGGIVYAAEILMDAKSISYTGEYTDKTNVADAIDELLNESKGKCPDGYDCGALTYTLTFDANGGNCSLSSKTVTYDGIYGQLPTPIKSGYAFGGWYSDPEFKKYIYGDSIVKTNKNHTLYAKWGTPIEITFEANGGTITYESKNVINEGKYGDLPRGYKENYYFDGWYADEALTKKIDEKSTVTISEDHTLYAKWVEGNEKLYNILATKVDKTKKSSSFSYANISSATNGRGLYEYDGVESADGGIMPIYFYRGNITDNNVLFAGYCWKIIRTTSTGGVKILYNGVPTGANKDKCTTQSGAGTFVKEAQQFNSSYSYYYNSYYTYDTSMGNIHGVGTNSLIKSYIENEWFITSNFVDEDKNETYEYTNLIEDHPYCIDRRYAKTNAATDVLLPNLVSNNTMYAGGFNRLKRNVQPALDCYHYSQQFTDKLTVKGGQLKKKVGLISGDEMRLAGGVFQVENTDYYLNIGSGYAYWGMSPCYFDGSYARTFCVNSNGMYEGYNGTPNQTKAVRPVVSLANIAKVSQGHGTSDDPYIIDAN